ncbi:PQQ-dependent sugar dehydrogenase [Rahnella sp. AN3-3W3]|uniref:PQQ-dependent sugar dehydrogenase n=1 Tax=Rahnella sp. AN3-3W3 TaxID=1610578 RepID=UPI000DD3D134|nr:PQQ-dependent sugar dehydrogenase [Rahnella sp. AN3-3W3]
MSFSFRDTLLPVFTLVLISAHAGAAPKSPVPPSKAGAQVTELANGLDHPWSLAFLPDNQGALITERSGQLRLWKPDGGLSSPLKGVPRVWVSGQAGLWDVRLSPDFASNRRVYLTFSQPGEKGEPHAALGYGTLLADNKTLSNFKVIFIQQPALQSGINLGGRMAFDDKGNIYLSTGDNNQRINAQHLNQLQGKILRLTPEGGIPQDNPFVHDKNAKPEIWTYGNRNPQGLAINPWSGALWETEHGPRGGDEVNFAQPGKNYGWPLATFGINYSGQPIPEAKGTTLAGAEDPIYYWEVSPALSGMAFYNAQTFPQWKNSLFVGALAGESLIRLTLDGDKVTHEERLLSDRKERIREVQIGSDGFVYVLTDESDGKLLKVAPQN